MHGATFKHSTDCVAGHIKSPNMLPALVLCLAQQGTAVIGPHQRRLGFTVPFVAEDFPSHCTLACTRTCWQLHARQTIGLGVADFLVRCQEGQLQTICAVNRRREIPGAVIQHIVNALHFVAAQFYLRQGHARGWVLTAVWIVHKDNAFAVGCNGKIICASVAALQFVICALQQVMHTACGNVHDTQVRHTVHGQVVIPMSVNRIFCGKSSVFDSRYLFEFFGLRFKAF